MMKLFKKQRNAIYYLNHPDIREVIYGGAAGGGKSALLCLRAIEMAQKYKGSRWMLGRSKLKTLKQTTLNTFFEVASAHDVGNQFTFNQQSNTIHFKNGSDILLKDLFYYPSDPEFDELGSLEICGAFVDEVSQVTWKAWQISQSRCRYKLHEFDITPKILGTCNPWKGWGYNEFYKPKRDGCLKKTRAFVQALPTDNPHLPKSYLDSLLQLDENSRQRLYYGNWEYDDDPAWLIDSYDAVVDIFTNEGTGTGKYITVDAARFGSDKAIMLVWEGWRVIDYSVMEISKTTDISAKVKQFQRKYNIANRHVIVDSDGVGGGVADETGAVNFVNNAKPLKVGGKDENFANLQSQCGFYLADRINDSSLAIKCELPGGYKDEIGEELEQLKKTMNDGESKKKLIGKDSIKAMIGRSPDWRDALLMRSYFDLAPKRKPNKAL